MQLTLVGSNLHLAETNGEGIFINGVTRSLPSGGVDLADTGTAANTTYYIYAYWTGSAVALEYDATGPDVDTTGGRVGIKIKNGNNSRSLVGMARTDGSAHWVDTPSKRFVISWFNRRPIAGGNAFANNRTTTSTSWAELSSSERIEFLTWGDSAVWMGFAGSISSNNADNFTWLHFKRYILQRPEHFACALAVPAGFMRRPQPRQSAQSTPGSGQGSHDRVTQGTVAIQVRTDPVLLR